MDSYDQCKDQIVLKWQLKGICANYPLIISPGLHTAFLTGTNSVNKPQVIFEDLHTSVCTHNMCCTIMTPLIPISTYLNEYIFTVLKP